MSHRLFITGSRASFRRPEFAFDHATYDVITPMAARGIFEAVHWTPSIRWIIERITVLRPIRITWSAIDVSETGEFPGFDGSLRIAHLADVAYVIDARFELTARAGPAESDGQHAGMFRRRARARRFFREPYLGRRDLPADVHLLKDGEMPTGGDAPSGRIDLGWMLHDRNPARSHRLSFYRPQMIDGVIDLTSLTNADLFG